MEYELIADGEYAGLPRELRKRFLALERIVRQRTSEIIDREDFDHPNMGVRIQYMNTVAAAAEELEVPDIVIETGISDTMARYERFIGDVTYQITKLNLRTASGTDKETVLLANATRAKIELQIRRLRDMIAKSNLSPQRRDGLLKKLDELSQEVIQPRVRFAVVMAVIAAVGIAASETTSFLADAPDAVMTIARLLGVDKEAEDAEVARLGPAPIQKSLPAPSDVRSARPPAFEPGGMDDDIPF